MTTNELNLELSSLSQLDAVASQLINFFGQEKLVLFEAELGAGKTTLIKAICKALGSQDHFSSPTYSIVNEYNYPQGKIFHFDLYRINRVEELFDIGIEDYLNSNNYRFFEWPQKVIDVIDSNYIHVEINLNKNIRYIRASKIST